MSRQNKVNPGQYTQRGRLTQDDAAREMARQRFIGSQNTWQPVQKDPPKKAPSAETAGKRASKTRPATKATAPDEVKTRQRSKKSAVAAPKSGRTAILARNVGGGARKPLEKAPRRTRR